MFYTKTHLFWNSITGVLMYNICVLVWKIHHISFQSDRVNALIHVSYRQINAVESECRRFSDT